MNCKTALSKMLLLATLTNIGTSWAQQPIVLTQDSRPNTPGDDEIVESLGTNTYSLALPAMPLATSRTPSPSRAAQELKQEERQRILGFVPDFNTSNIPDADPLTWQQKFQLAMRTSLDPTSFVAAAFDAGLGSFGNPKYGAGMVGYQKRFAASYTDSFDGALLGNALAPALLHQDPRYFRKGEGSFGSRLYYAVLATVRCKNDNGKWAPNYSNLLGNLAAGAIANAYYPEQERGASLTFQRSFVVTAEGSLGAIVSEFWPDISSRLFKKRK